MSTTPENPENGLLEAQMLSAHSTSQRSEGEALPFLESITNIPSQPQETRSPQVLVYMLQAIARELMPDERVAWCMRRFLPYREVVDIVRAPKRGAAYFHGLMRCSRIWMCPVCARKISETRRRELDELIEGAKMGVYQPRWERWVQVPKYHLSMLTFTLKHEWDEPATKVLARLAKAYARFAAGRWYQGFKQTYFIVGTLKALEITHGESGWHPHYHVLIFHDSYLSPKRQMDYTASARLHWQEVVFDIGGETDLIHGVDMSFGANKLYPVKLAGDREIKDWSLVAEATKQPVKHGRNGNRSLTDLLIAYAHGDVHAGELWIEAVYALNRQKHIHASKGLWKMLGRGMSEDEAAAEDIPEPTDEILASLTWTQWQAVIRHDARGQVLDVAAKGDSDELWKYLETLGIEKAEAESTEASAPYLD